MRDKPATDLVEVPSPEGLTAHVSGLQPGEKLGRYELEARIGEGAFAEVWRAVEVGGHGFRKRVALKILKQEGDDPERLDALLDEARLCGHLHHPGLVDVYGVATDRGHTFVAMEWVDGIALDKLLDRFTELQLRIPPSVAVDLGIQICAGLSHAHQATDHDGNPLHLIHRDLKPANILLTWNGHAKITDWGIAKAATSNRSTQSGMLRGTPSYVAPEVWLGHREFNPTNDLFAVGAILWEVVAGEILLRGDIPVIIGLATKGDIEEDIQRLRLFSPELCPAVRGLLQRDPAQRISSASDARRMLEEAARNLRAGGGLDALMETAAPIVGRSTGHVGLSGRVRDLLDHDDHSWSALLDCAALHGLDMDADETLVSAGFAPAEELSEEAVPGTRKVPTAPPPSPPPSGPTSVRPSLLGAGLAAVLFALILAFSQWAGGVGRETSPPEVDPGPATDEAAAAADLSERAPRGVEATTDLDPEPASAADPTGTAPPDPTPTASPPPMSSPEPTAKPARLPRAEAASVPTRKPRSVPAVEPRSAPAPEPAAVANGCLVLQSSPPGAEVFLDGAATGLHAGSGSSVGLGAVAGTHSVGMGITADSQVTTTVDLTAGARATVWCDLIGAAGCRVTPSGRCD